MCGALSKAQVNDTLYPYLQSASPTSVYITWKTSSGSQSLVNYGTTAGNLNLSANGNNQIWTDAGYSNNYYYHTVKLTGLTPNTKYYYKITTGAWKSAVCNFKTFPNPGSAAVNGHIRFLVMGDNQIQTEPRYDSMMVSAKRKLTEKFGGDPCDNVSMIFMGGDQVDAGTLIEYDTVHFMKDRYLSPYLPIQTTVGNHETYGSLALQGYYNHFYLDSLTYQGVSSGTEDYYAYQLGNILFLSLTTEAATTAENTAQLTWIQQVVTAANSDATVSWIISVGHRPYQAEQYVGDISPWIRNTAVPYLITSPKYWLHIGAHHHLYARGQLKESPVYNVISGGTAWDQYWNMSVQQDMNDVQKTISNWIYQIFDVDVVNQKIDVESYSIGSIYEHKNNVLMDSFHRYKNQAGPAQPTFANTLPDSLQLPFTINSSAFSSPVGELLNSTDFQVSQNKTFTTLQYESYRDFEDLFGEADNRPDSSIDQNAGVNILNCMLDTGSMPNGKYYVRLRHRDRNLNWSAWSPIDSFKVYNSVFAPPTITTNKYAYQFTDTIKVTYSHGPGLATDWIGIYKKGDIPGNTNSTLWSYVNSASLNSGLLNLIGITTAGAYYVAYFTNDTYTEIATRDTIWVGPIPTVTTNLAHYNVGDTVKVTYTGAPGILNDWLGIYRIGNIPETQASTQSVVVTGATGTNKFLNLPKGYYSVNYFIAGGFVQPGQPAFFSVGDTIANLKLNKSIYNLNEYITATWMDGPGLIKDWLGFYHKGDVPSVNPLDTYTYFGGVPNGTKVIKDSILPPAVGNYFIVMFTNDSYTEVSNRVYFTIVDTAYTTGINNPGAGDIKLYPNPASQDGNTIIESKYPIDKLQILDQNSREIFVSRNVASRNFTLVNHELPAGVYYIKIYQDNRKIYTYKLIVAN